MQSSVSANGLRQVRIRRARTPEASTSPCSFVSMLASARHQILGVVVVSLCVPLAFCPSRPPVVCAYKQLRLYDEAAARCPTPHLLLLPDPCAFSWTELYAQCAACSSSSHSPHHLWSFHDILRYARARLSKCCQVVLAQLVTFWLQLSSRVSARQAAPVYRPYRLQVKAGESQRNPGVTKKRTTGPPFLPPVTPKVRDHSSLPCPTQSR